MSDRSLKRQLQTAFSQLGRGAQLARHELWRAQLMLIHLALLEKRDGASPPSQQTIQAVQQRYYALLKKDWDNLRRGAYPYALLRANPLLRSWRQWPALFVDILETNRRAARRGYLEVPAGARGEYPAYYARCFHWQSDGYLSQHSAKLYEVSVELLFLGCADVMRRQTLAALNEQERIAPLSLLDIACGTGAFLRQAATALPNAKLSGIDLSPYYAAEAAHTVPTAKIATGNAESLPYADNSFDVVTSIFLFHELPKNVRRRVLDEALRVLKPGGKIIIEDSVQLNDSPELGEVLEHFHQSMHEPFFKGYLRDPLEDVLRGRGVEHLRVEPSFLAKVVSATV